MPRSDYLSHMRELVGREMLLLPSVTVLPLDRGGRLLLVRESDTGKWGTIGGTVEPGESPAAAAVREAREEAGVDVVLGPILTSVGGRGYEVEYPNGDRCAYVAVVFEAEVAGGTATADGHETIAVRWFQSSEPPEVHLNTFALSVHRAGHG